MPLTIVSHPLAAHCLAKLRDRDTPPSEFRLLSRKITTILALEASRDMQTAHARIATPLEETDSETIDEKIVCVPILRAGLGMVEGIADILPDVAVGHVGLERNETTAVARSYYCKLPPMKGKTALLVDPMLATGGSALQALREIFKQGASRVRLICIVAAPEGVAAIESAFPTLPIFTAALDRGLNHKKYIVPGLGDFGDRLYGTR